jgi:hypothetical protein
MGAALPISIEYDGAGGSTLTHTLPSGRVKGVTITRGFRRPLQWVCDEYKAEIIVSNHDGEFSLAAADAGESGITLSDGSSLHIGRMVRITDTSRSLPLFTGWIDDIAPDPLKNKGREVAIRLTTMRNQLQAIRASTALMTDISAATAIQQLFERAFVGSRTDGWQLGESELGVNTALWGFDGRYGVSMAGLEAAEPRYPFIGDNWTEATSLLNAIGDIAAADEGRFFFTPEGQLWYASGSFMAMLKAGAAAASWTDKHAAASFTYSDDYRNAINVTFYPRSVSATADEILWSIPEPLTLNPTEREFYEVRFRLPDGTELVKADEVRLTDFSYTGRWFISRLHDVTTDGCTVEIYNQGDNSGIASTLNIRGRLYRAYDAGEAEAQDLLHINKHGERRERVSIRTMADRESAQARAQALLDRLKRFGAMRSVTFIPRTLALAQEYTPDLLTKIQITDGQLHAGAPVINYLVIGQTMTWKAGLNDYRVELTLERI